ncbi:MAG: aminopeptidase [Bacteroidales bacterium]|nr:aminopeptidase [Bacteroidales bacterium]
MQKQIPATPVKNQNRTNTCWSFSAVSMLESELIKANKGEYDLSEMFIVYHNYLRKADKFVRMHGTVEFAGGGENNDVTDVMKTLGLVPESVFSGLKPGETGHNHMEMDKVLKSYMEEIVKNGTQPLSPVWMNGFEGILKSYLGNLPTQFTYQGKQFTPESFSTSLGINPNDYIMVSSFTHHPFYETFIPELPDNWSWGKAYNVPLDEFQSIVDNALNTGYSIAWASDVSDKGFNFKQGVAIVPDFDEKKATQSDWDKAFASPAKEKQITQELRQVDFDNYSTTDDHGMHITGLATDQSGNKYYYVKNSWGTENPYKGYIYVSGAFFKLRTTVIFLNKNGIPEVLRKKMGV